MKGLSRKFVYDSLARDTIGPVAKSIVKTHIKNKTIIRMK